MKDGSSGRGWGRKREGDRKTEVYKDRSIEIDR